MEGGQEPRREVWTQKRRGRREKSERISRRFCRCRGACGRAPVGGAAHSRPDGCAEEPEGRVDAGSSVHPRDRPPGLGRGR